ncbi:hypothetical protein B0I35DRAFT_439890 [Stachybotrys elegans]|uniref:Uncharacterized protein n=1 Tax=Stachybotrys elegans TaxID=80388 RepID=A0A8K0SLJ0_9HYPO|nr:hypothetical protein B0I35DRAFT_439890 [Stachybotrys elegans]
MSHEFIDDLIAPGRSELTSMPNPGATLAKELASLPLPSLTNSLEAILAKADITLRSNIEVDVHTLPDVSIEETQARLIQKLASQTALTNKSLIATESLMPGLLETSNRQLIQYASAPATPPFSGPHYWMHTGLTEDENFLTVTASSYAPASNVPPNTQDLSAILLQQHAAAIGGAIVRDIKLILGEGKKEDVKFCDVPVLPLQVPETEQAMLFSRMPEQEGDTPDFTLILPEKYIAPPGFEGVELFPDVAIDDKDGVIALQKDVTLGMKKSELQLYTIVGDIVDFWGIQGLTAKLYKYKGIPQVDEDKKPIVDISTAESATEEPAREKVVLNAQSLMFQGRPLGTLFPFINSKDIANLPIASLELTYSEEKTKNPLHKPGLRLEVDIELKDSLEWAGDSIKALFGSLDTPTIHLSAFLSETRNWSKPPTIEKLVLQGYFKDMSLNPWNMLEFKTMGIEITAEKSSGSWYFGFGFIGEVDLIGIPGTRVPRGLSYRLARDPVLSGAQGEEAGRKWDLLLVAEDCNDLFGFENVAMTKAFLEASFYEGHFNSSISLDIGGQIKVGQGTFEVAGRFTKGWADSVTWTWLDATGESLPLAQEDYFIQAIMGNMNFRDLKDVYAQITGQQPADAGHDDMTFKNMSIKIACTKYTDSKLDRKSLELAGEVTVGDATTYSARLTFATEGIAVVGAVSNVHIPGTDVVIEKAGLRAFLALKTSSVDSAEGAVVSKKDQKKETRKRRQSSFEILGVIHFHDVTFRAGFYTANNEGKRDWLVFGSAERIRLREAWPDIPHNSFLNLQLENVSVIASSKDRKRGGHTKTGSNDIHREWDVLDEIEALDYPIVQGFQICATIVSFQQLEQMSNGKIDGLMLYLGYSTQVGFTASVRLPPSFRIDVSKQAYLHQVTTSIVIDKTGPYLELKATLTINMEQSDPIHVTGLIVGSLKGVNGELYMEPDSRWANPFNLHKELIVSNLGIGVGFDYATVLVVGPTRLSFKGQVNIAEYQGNMDVGVDVTKAAAVLRIELNKLDVTDIVKIAGKLAEQKALENAADGARGLVVFSDLKLYLSSGAKFMGEYYERGIQIRGKLNFFDKLAYFDGTFTEDGVLIKGGFDAFKFGGLEVTSLKTYRGKKRAILEIEVLKDTQKVLIDGILRYYDIELQVYINANLQTRQFEADILVKLADVLSFALKAKIEAKDSQDLENAVVIFEAHLELKILESVIQGILKALETLKEWADKKIDEVKAQVEGRLAVLRIELAEMEKSLIELRQKSHQEVLKRRNQIDEENKLLRETNEEIDKYEQKVKEARANKNAKEEEIREYERRRDAAQSRLDKKTREMREEYNRRIREEEANQEHWRAERRRLQDKRDASWGDDLRKRETAEANWRYWTGIENERYAWKQTCEWNLDNCDWWDKPYWATKLAEAAVGLEQAHASKAIEAEILHVIEVITNSDEFKTVENGINNAIDEASRFGRALQELVDKGPMAYIEEMSRDEKRDLQRQINLLQSLENDSRELQSQLAAAERALKETRGRLSPKQEAARKNIVDLEAAIKLKPWEAEYRNKKADFDRIKTQADGLLQTLDDIKKGISVGEDLIRQAVKFLEFIPEIQSIHVTASSEILVNNAPLTFGISVKWHGEIHMCYVEWSPNQDAHELYSNAARKMVGLADIINP